MAGGRAREVNTGCWHTRLHVSAPRQRHQRTLASTTASRRRVNMLLHDCVSADSRRRLRARASRRSKSMVPLPRAECLSPPRPHPRPCPPQRDSTRTIATHVMIVIGERAALHVAVRLHWGAGAYINSSSSSRLHSDLRTAPRSTAACRLSTAAFTSRDALGCSDGTPLPGPASPPSLPPDDASAVASAAATGAPGGGRRGCSPAWNSTCACSMWCVAAASGLGAASSSPLTEPASGCTGASSVWDGCPPPPHR